VLKILPAARKNHFSPSQNNIHKIFSHSTQSTFMQNNTVWDNVKQGLPVHTKSSTYHG